MASTSRNNLDMGEASKKRMPGSEYMLLCHKGGETMHHIFIESTFTKGVWELTRATKNTLIQYLKPNNINRMWSHDYLQWATRGGKHKIRTIIGQYFGMCVNKKIIQYSVTKFLPLYHALYIFRMIFCGGETQPWRVQMEARDNIKLEGRPKEVGPHTHGEPRHINCRWDGHGDLRSCLSGWGAERPSVRKTL